MKKKVILFTSILVLTLSLASLSNIDAQNINVDISGNASGSQNQVNLDQQNTSQTNQQNTANINNDVNVDCNTGSNQASGNTGSSTSINTGDCSANVNIRNDVNRNVIGGPKASPKLGASPSPTVFGQPGPGGGGVGAAGNGGAGAGGPGVGPGELAEAGVAGNLAMFSGGMASILLGLWFVRRKLAITS